MFPDVSMMRGNHPEGPRGEKGSTGFMESLEGKTTGTSSSDLVSTKLQRIAQLAREAPERVLLTLAHHIDVEFLHEAFNQHDRLVATCRRQAFMKRRSG